MGIQLMVLTLVAYYGLWKIHTTLTEIRDELRRWDVKRTQKI